VAGSYGFERENRTLEFKLTQSFLYMSFVELIDIFDAKLVSMQVYLAIS
jgi:hypothetical protein